MGDFDMLSNLGVEVPYKVVRLSKPPSSFIMEAGGVCAKYEKNKIDAARTFYENRGSRSPRSGSVPSRNGSVPSGADTMNSNTSSWRSDWRPHAQPMQRSHFSTSNPSSCMLGSNEGPISENAHEMLNHRKISKHASPRLPHPLEAQHYSNTHKSARSALKKMDANRNFRELPAAGARSEKITRSPVPSDITGRHVAENEPVYQPAVVSGPKLWTAERDRKEREREKNDCVVGKEKVLRASSPPKERQEHIVPEGPRLWTAERDLRLTRRSSSTPNHPLMHQHKKLHGDGGLGSNGQVGHQPSDLQRRWDNAGWWAPQSSPTEVRPKPEYVPPSPSTRATYGVPNYSKRGYEPTDMSIQRRHRSPSSTRKWRP